MITLAYQGGVHLFHYTNPTTLTLKIIVNRVQSCILRREFVISTRSIKLWQTEIATLNSGLCRLLLLENTNLLLRSRRRVACMVQRCKAQLVYKGPGLNSPMRYRIYLSEPTVTLVQMDVIKKVCHVEKICNSKKQNNLFKLCRK